MKKETQQKALQKYKKKKKTVMENYEQLYTNKFDNIEEMDKFLETHSPPKLKEEIANLYKSHKVK